MAISVACTSTGAASPWPQSAGNCALSQPQPGKLLAETPHPLERAYSHQASSSEPNLGVSNAYSNAWHAASQCQQGNVEATQVGHSKAAAMRPVSPLSRHLEAAPPATAHGASAFGVAKLAPHQHRWPEAQMMNDEVGRLHQELHGNAAEVASLAHEVQFLRRQILEERERRRNKMAESLNELQALQRENGLLQQKLLKQPPMSVAQTPEAVMVKREVVAKTMQLEKMMREFQKLQQETFFTPVCGIMNSMIAASSSNLPANAFTGIASNSFVDASPSAAADVQVNAGPVMPEPPTAPVMDAATQQALKQRLQALGDVVVYTSDKFEACCASGRSIPPGSLRVRPRRCDHVFLIECIVPYWAEGLCPVCRCSFAHDKPEEIGVDDNDDRYSSLSVSVSQVSSALPRRDGDHRRGPKILRNGRSVGTAPDARERSPSPMRESRIRAHSASFSARSDASGPLHSAPGDGGMSCVSGGGHRKSNTLRSSASTRSLQPHSSRPL